ncbi:dynein heavy chain [Savitreella phatthalungensis]
MTNDKNQVEHLCAYLAGQLPVAIGTTDSGTDSLQIDGSSLDELASFCRELEPRVIFFDTESRKLVDGPNTSKECLAVVKGSGCLTSGQPLSRQLHTVTLNSQEDASGLRLVVSDFLKPLCDALAQNDDVKKRLNEFQLSLTNSADEAGVGKVQLPIHSSIHDVLSRNEAESSRPTVSLLDQSRLEDQHWLNEVQASVNTWRRLMNDLISRDRAVESGTIANEIRFWCSLDDALEDVEGQLKSDGVRLTMDVLQAGRRFGVVVSLENDSTFRDARKHVHEVAGLMRDLPIGVMLSAISLSDLGSALTEVLGMFSRRLRVVAYPVRRALAFLEGLSGELDVRMRAMLGHRLLAIPYGNFQDIMAAAARIYNIWEEDIKEFTSVAREAIKKRGEKFLPIKINGRHVATRDRLAVLNTFRSGHEALLQAFDKSFGSHDDGSHEVASQIEAAYTTVQNIDCLDLSDVGFGSWSEAQNRYTSMLSAAEDSIIADLSTELSASDTTAHLFRSFARFSGLFVRPRIRNAVQEYQSQLVDRVKADVSVLQAKAHRKYIESDCHTLAQLHDVPIISGSVMWTRQISERLDELMYRLEDILGTGWELYAEGAKLQSEANSLRLRLDVRPLLDGWMRDLQVRKVQIGGPVFHFTLDKLDGDVDISVNFDPRVVTLFKEVRNLQWMSYNVPHQIAVVAKAAQRAYPVSISLVDALKSAKQIFADVEHHPWASLLVAGLVDSVHDALEVVAGLHWDSFVLQAAAAEESGDSDTISDGKQNRAVQHLVASLDVLSSKLSSVFEIIDRVETTLQSMQTTPLLEINEQYFRPVYDAVAEVRRQELDNTEAFADAIDSRLCEALTTKLDDSVTTWCVHLSTTGASCSPLEPGFEKVVSTWWADVNRLVEHVSNLRKARLNATFSDLTDELAGRIFEQTTLAITKQASLVREYLTGWIASQGVWDVQLTDIEASLGTGDMQQWLDLLTDVHQYRANIDSTDRSKQFGPLLVIFEQVQSRMMSRYDAIQRDISERLHGLAEERLTDALSAIRRQRLDMERLAINAASPVAMILAIQACKRDLPIWYSLHETLVQIKRLLARNRQREKLELFNLSEELSSLDALHVSSDRALQGQYEKLRDTIMAQTHTFSANVERSVRAWEEHRPLRGEIDPPSALVIIAEHEKSATALRQQDVELERARQALGMTTGEDKWLAEISTEMQDLRSVWQSILPVWDRLEDLRQMSVTSASAGKVRDKLKELRAIMDEMPVRIRQYDAFEYWYGKVVDDLLPTTTILKDLLSDVFHDRHWGQLLGASFRSRKDLTLGSIWALDLRSNNCAVQQILRQARGEYSNELFLSGIEDLWQGYELASVDYRGRCQLISGIDDVVNKAGEHLAALASMRHSPYYTLFREQAEFWSERLSRLTRVFETWRRVQRSWTYLDGTFAASSDIRYLLPKEASRFMAADGAFVTLCQKAAPSRPLAVADIADVEQTLARLQDQLDKVKNSLGQYLDRERSVCPRFFFLGNDDLLEIIGNSQDFARVDRHLSKLFAGIVSIEIQAGAVTAVQGQLGERLELDCDVIVQGLRAAQWLPLLEQATRAAMQHHTASLIAQLRKGDDVLDSVLPGQLVILAHQCYWTERMQKALETNSFDDVDKHLKRLLASLSDRLTDNLSALQRMTFEGLLTTVVHQETSLNRVKADRDQWLFTLRHYHNEESRAVHVRLADVEIAYAWEYLGPVERLVQTPLTDAFYLNMTQALNHRLGGAPFGPAGTGKTETVKSLGLQLGTFVVVFCCDDSFDYDAIGRIFTGACQIGAWACFDEFNRLEPAILSAVSQQIRTIQQGLSQGSERIELLARPVPLSATTAIFITTNPDYAGRSRLPDNLRRLFRPMAMSRPDSSDIARVLLHAQGFSSATQLADTIVMLFQTFETSFSHQKHYDFGLRALKSALIIGGQLKRSLGRSASDGHILVTSLNRAIAPRLIAADEAIFRQLVATKIPIDGLADDAPLLSGLALKIQQLIHVQEIQNGIIVFGGAGTGKTTVWRAAVEALGPRARVYVIDAKTLDKAALYGHLDDTTRHWTDGVLTDILRSIAESAEPDLRRWIVFDGDIDPVWIENLNSVLDDNHFISLPNGERIRVNANTRFIFETDSINHATPATISRCGMIHISDSAIGMDDLQQRFAENIPSSALGHLKSLGALPLRVCGSPIMPQSQAAYYDSLRALISDKELSIGQVARAVVWAAAGAGNVTQRRAVAATMQLDMPPNMLADESILSFRLIAGGAWRSLAEEAPKLELGPESLDRTDIIVSTAETIALEDLLVDLLRSSRPIVLCGPPGSGKTMLLLGALRRLEGHYCIPMNFSSATSVDHIVSALEQHCRYTKGPTGLVLGSPRPGHKAVLFCDEVNLTTSDAFGSQPVISFLRNLIEHQGFYHKSARQWVAVRDVLIVGACNPPTDIGRTALSDRFLRHCSVVLVDHPTRSALQHIYRVLFGAALRDLGLSQRVDAVVQASLDVYDFCRTNLTTELQPHYVYSPRELTRWVRGLRSLLVRLSDRVSPKDLVCAWAQEGSRLFEDRLVYEQERHRVAQKIRAAAEKHLGILPEQNLLYSDWLSKTVAATPIADLNSYVSLRLGTYSDEVEGASEIVAYNELSATALKISRVFHQPQGHAILVGAPGTGKSTLVRFVAWLDGLKVHRIRAHASYTITDFDDDLRKVLRACTVGRERVCFVLDEGSLLESAFIERINTLLANAEVPGLFEGDDLTNLISGCREQAELDGTSVQTPKEALDWFTEQIVHNLHVVLTISPPRDLAKSVNRSPALFNRCVVLWTGCWSEHSTKEIISQKLSRVDLSSKLHASHELQERLSDVIWSMHDGEALKLLDLLDRTQTLLIQSRQKLEHEQARLHKGLARLKATAEDVASLKTSLITTKAVLLEKNRAANTQLENMVYSQQESERRRATSLALQRELERQDEEIKARQDVVMADLARAEPAVEEARRSVSDIKKQQLTELRSMANPPEAVKLALEAVCSLLGHSNPDSWRTVQGIIRREDFISSIVHFDGESRITPSLRAKIQRDYLALPLLQHEVVHRASKACGPLILWVEAQIAFSEIVERVAPLRIEVEELQSAALTQRHKIAEAATSLSLLEASIVSLKDDYAQLVGEAQEIAKNMRDAEIRLERSQALLDGLAGEVDRWTISADCIQDKDASLLGDVLLAAAFEAYAIPRARADRQALMEKWRVALEGAAIPFSYDWSYLSFIAPEHEAQDEHTAENLVALDNIQRTSLIVDPAEQHLHAIKAMSSRRELVIASFSDYGFSKQLESAVRFGRTLLITDAEHFDPIVFALLNREYTNVGGRLVVMLGKQQVDISTNFTMILYTTAPVAAFSENVLSRLSIVDFSVTNASLRDLALATILQVHQPEVESQRREARRAQRALHVELADNENQLLEALAQSSNILDNVEVIRQLELLRTCSDDIKFKLKAGDHAIAQIQAVTDQYEHDATSTAAVYEILQTICGLSPLYTFKLAWFTTMLRRALARRAEFLPSLIEETLSTASASLLPKHVVDLKISLARLLAVGAEQQTEWQQSHIALDRTLRDYTGTELEPKTLAQIQAESDAETPILLVADAGQDPAYEVEAAAGGTPLETVSLGAGESIALAERMLDLTARSGTWLVLKNVHLEQRWLESLRVRVVKARPMPSFRLFLTTEQTAVVPKSFLAGCITFAAIAPAGLRASLTEAIVGLSSQFEREPRERRRLGILTGWLHAYVIERLRFAPKLGWRKAYELGSAELTAAGRVLNAWLPVDKHNIDPQEIPWGPLARILTQSVYGAVMDDMKDFAHLGDIVSHLFHVGSFDLDFDLTPSQTGLIAPAKNKLEDVLDWAASLAPSSRWLSLPEDAEQQLAANQFDSAMIRQA